MLRLLSSQLSDHPLDSRRARRALVDDFAKMAPLAILSEISGYLDAIKTADDLKPARALEIIEFLDITGAPVQRGLTQEYRGRSACYQIPPGAGPHHRTLVLESTRRELPILPDQLSSRCSRRFGAEGAAGKDHLQGTAGVFSTGEVGSSTPRAGGS
jgi:hypothetical protein